MYFGSHDGTFRIYPGLNSDTCGGFDPRVRPWYIAASSGPKNIILILDVSGSMGNQNNLKLNLMQQAAILVINTLAVGDQVAIVTFNDTVQVFGDGSGLMLNATSSNKAQLVNIVNGLTAFGGDNYYDAFEKAFDTFDNTVKAQLNVPCNSAILFFTDGRANGSTNSNQNVTNLVSSRLSNTTAAIGRPILLFTYSVHLRGDELLYPKQLACNATEFGVWTNLIADGTGLDSAKLTSYFQLFALGLGDDQNKDFVAWVEPYIFLAGTDGVLGTTASAAVYDYSRNPPIFLGVVGIDFTMASFEKALGVPAGSQAAINSIVNQAYAVCPSLNLTACVIESYRRSTGNESACGTCSAKDLVVVVEEACPNAATYPTYLWNNNYTLGMSYAVRYRILRSIKLLTITYPLVHRVLDNRNERAVYLIK